MLRVCVLIVLNERWSSHAISRCDSSLRSSRRTDSSASTESVCRGRCCRERRAASRGLQVPLAACSGATQDARILTACRPHRRLRRSIRRASSCHAQPLADTGEADQRIPDLDRRHAAARELGCAHEGPIRGIERRRPLEQLAAYRERQRAGPVLRRDRAPRRARAPRRRARRRSRGHPARTRSPRGRRSRASRPGGCRWPSRSAPPRSSVLVASSR